MTIQALAWALDQPIPGNAKLALLALANHADHTTGYVHFDLPTISREASIQERSLWRYFGALERNGYLTRDVRKSRGTEVRELRLALDRDPSIGWTWGAQDGEPEGAEPPAAPEPRAPSTAPVGFRPREAPTPPAPETQGIPVLEGSKAAEMWLRYLRDRRKTAPFVMSMIIDGKERRGFYMPTLFPPDDNIEGAA